MEVFLPIILIINVITIFIIVISFIAWCIYVNSR